MRKYTTLFLLAVILILNSCMNGQTQNPGQQLEATAFAEKIKQVPQAVILDVRTPEEFAKGHLINALNFDWNGNIFEQQLEQLDKTKPVFVYCLSGGRSSSAANKMRKEGFKDVYELNGGIMKWRGANLPEVKENANASSGMTRQQFNQLIISEKLVLVDFYADWCAPCKKMKPCLEEISKEMADRAIVIRINADDNQSLCKELKIDALPVLQLYKNRKIVWSNIGFIEREAVQKQLNMAWK